MTGYNELKNELSSINKWVGSWWDLVESIEKRMVDETITSPNWQDIISEVRRIGLGNEFIGVLTEYQIRNRNCDQLLADLTRAISKPVFGFITDPKEIAGRINIFDNPGRFFTAYKTIGDQTACNRAIMNRIFDQKKRVDRLEEEFNLLGGFFDSPRDLISLYMRKEGIEWRGNSLTHNGYSDVKQFTLADLKGVLAEFVVSKELCGLPLYRVKDLCSQQNVRNFVETYIMDIDAEQRRNSLKVVAFDPEVNAGASWDLIDSIFKIKGSDYKPSAVLRHWIWLVKRRAVLQPTLNDIVPTIYGGQLIGKSTFVRRLTDVLSDYKSESDWANLTDKANQSVFSSYIIFVDEMSKLDKADQPMVKKIITAGGWTSRVLFTNISTKVECRAAIIGTSNEPIIKLFTDFTGMRRWVEITVEDRFWGERGAKTPSAEQREEFRGIVNQIDFLALWRSVDSSVDSKFDVDQLTKHQESITARDFFSEWLDDEHKDEHRSFDNNSVGTPWVDYKKQGDLWKENFEPWIKWVGVSWWGGAREFNKCLDQARTNGRVLYKKNGNYHWYMLAG